MARKVEGTFQVPCYMTDAERRQTPAIRAPA